MMKIIMTVIMMMVVMKMVMKMLTMMVMKMMSPAAVSYSSVDCGPHKCSAVIRF